jgi:hypothetical protein
MATIVYINTSNRTGAQVLSALENINSGLSTLRKLDGLRAESIGAGQATMAQNFGTYGVDETAENAAAQALSDRLGWLLAQVYDPTAQNYAAYAGLRDLLNATTAAP